jgi:MFS family permease
MSDIFGRKVVLYFCCLFFAIGIIVFGTARSPTTLIVGRNIKGFGGGALEALSEVILTDITSLQRTPTLIRYHVVLLGGCCGGWTTNRWCLGRVYHMAMAGLDSTPLHRCCTALDSSLPAAPTRHELSHAETSTS